MPVTTIAPMIATTDCRRIVKAEIGARGVDAGMGDEARAARRRSWRADRDHGVDRAERQGVDELLATTAASREYVIGQAEPVGALRGGSL